MPEVVLGLFVYVLQSLQFWNVVYIPNVLYIGRLGKKVDYLKTIYFLYQVITCAALVNIYFYMQNNNTKEFAKKKS